eukprot:TRINITY_DN3958_c0_g1_i2.p1 TRINITY_DN3958_c0_g1~~TRINITY_DN3958_c0_g1_i2.p1  ORF type:complete len:107 (-),score=19.89 TRINITY_DN3958_c0_g1_i2:47-331(-)
MGKKRLSRAVKPNPQKESTQAATGLKVLTKVHGSLARAGKVKGQTPKAEKQDKKKKPRGRAKKRMLYTRRFVNVVLGPGGRPRRYNQRPTESAL